MTHPTLPFAIVTFLADISEQRANLRKGPTHISVIAQHDKSVKSSRFEVENDANFAEVLQSALSMYATNSVDTMMFTYPTADEVDIGVIIEAGKEPMVVEWTYAPKFGIRLIEGGAIVDQVTHGVGVQEVLALMNRDNPAASMPGLPKKADAKPALTVEFKK